MSIEQRIKSMKTGNPYNIETIHIKPGNFDLEKRIHTFYSKFRVKGEWFKLPEDIINIVISKGFQYYKERTSKSKFEKNIILLSQCA